ncbi:MAG: tetratricopeptide repeat protein [Bryobacteraceae bacterium]
MEDAIRQRLLKLTEPLLATDDWPSVENLWRPYVNQGDLDAQAYLAHMCLWCFDETEEKDQEMRGLLRASANAGHADAMYWLASHGMSDGTERDELLKKAAELGSRGAQRHLGAMYATGDWTGPKDSTRAVYWYRLAAERGHHDAQYNLGFMYILGEGVTADVAEGLLWLLRSADQGNRSAMRLLADLYRNGHYGVPIEAEKAEHWDKRHAVAKARGHFYLHDMRGSL